MFSHIHSAVVEVSDQDAALKFYVETLGWELRTDAPMGESMRFLTVAPPGARTQLALGHSSWFNEEYPAPSRTGISLIAHDVEELYATLSERGVTFTGPPEMMPWGQKATWFFDPDGNTFLVSQE